MQVPLYPITIAFTLISLQCVALCRAEQEFISTYKRSNIWRWMLISNVHPLNVKFANPLVRTSLHERTTECLMMDSNQLCPSLQHRHRSPDKVSFHNDVFIPQTINGAVFAAVLLRRFKFYNGLRNTDYLEPWKGSASNDCVYINLAWVPRDISTRARVSLHPRMVKHLTTNTYQQCSSSECQYVNP